MADDKKRKKNNATSNAAAAKALLDRLEAETGNGAGGYETDAGPSTSKSALKKLKTRKRTKAPNDGGYETDDGYTSAPENRKKSGKKFFRLGNRSKSQLDENIPQIRAAATSPTPQFRLPIAERFATTLYDVNASATVDPPLPPLLPPSTFTSPTKTSKEPTVPESQPEQSKQTKQTVIRFASVTSESSSSSSSGGLSRFTSTSSSSASSASSPTSSSHHQRPLSPTTSPKKSRPDPLSLLSPNNGTGAKSTPNSRAPSPSPTGSPFVVLTPSDPSAPIPSEPPPSSSSLTRSKTRLIPELSLKIGQKVTEPPKRPVISSPIQLAEPQSAIETRGETLEPAPNTYSIYELPPPSPPPESSLPKVPPSSAGTAMPLSSSSSSSRTLYQTPTPSRSVSPSPFSQPVKRGVESPFPSRPILPISSRGGGGGGELNPSRVDRYRDLPGYVPSRPTSPAPHLRPDLHSLDTQGFSSRNGAGLSSAPPVLRQPTLRSPTPTNPSSKRANRYAVSFAPPPKSVGISVQGASDDEYEDEDEGYEDEVLNRFNHPRRSNEREREPALGRNRSIEAKARPRQQQLRPPKSAPTDYRGSSSLDDESLRDTIYSIDDSASRYSFMDQEKSENARHRFVDRIERMFDANGRELDGPNRPQLKPREMGIPPVPKLPEGLGIRPSPVVKVRPKAGSEGRSGWF